MSVHASLDLGNTHAFLKAHRTLYLWFSSFRWIASSTAGVANEPQGKTLQGVEIMQDGWERSNYYVEL